MTCSIEAAVLGGCCGFRFAMLVVWDTQPLRWSKHTPYASLLPLPSSTSLVF